MCNRLMKCATKELDMAISRIGENMEDRYLFKAKRVDNGEWVIGNLITNVFFRLGQSIPYILCSDKAEYDCFDDFTEEN